MASIDFTQIGSHIINILAMNETLLKSNATIIAKLENSDYDSAYNDLFNDYKKNFERLKKEHIKKQNFDDSLGDLLKD